MENKKNRAEEIEMELREAQGLDLNIDTEVILAFSNNSGSFLTVVCC